MNRKQLAIVWGIAGVILAVYVLLSLAACGAAPIESGGDHTPLRTGTQPASWERGHPECAVEGTALPATCLGVGAPMCLSEDGNEGTGPACLWRDPDDPSMIYYVAP
jgi:hypothetical protein